METLLAYLSLAVLLLLTVPTVLVLCRDGKTVSIALTAAVTPAITFGILSVVMLWMGLLGFPFSAPAIFIVTICLLMPGAYLYWKWRPKTIRPVLNSWRIFALVILGAVGMMILIDTALWPLFRDDAMAIYQPQAAQIAQLGGLIRLQGQNTLYEAYPMLIQMNYGYVYLASGWENDYLAKLVPAILAVACLPAVFHLGNRAGGEAVGWLSALLLALTPTYGSWATSGYTDLPMALYLALAAVFGLRLWDHGRKTDALAVGLMLGFAAWTKNNALIAMPSFGLWMIILLWQRRVRLTHLLITAGAALLIAGTWYARNLLEANILIPPTAWTEQAERTIGALLIFVTLFGTYGFTGWLIVLGVVDGGVTLLRRRWAAAPQMLLLLVSVPFFAAWWWFASYDERFVLAILPMLCVFAGGFALRLWRFLPPTWRPAARWAAAAGMLALTGFILWNTLEYKDNLLRQPLMGDAERRQTVGREIIPP